MKVSVVICTYSMDTYTDLSDAIGSIRKQTYRDVEIVVVVDGNQELFELVVAEWGEQEGIIVHCTEENCGLSASRNEGIERASGDVIAFLDDDAVADAAWVETLVSVYEELNVEAVGGKMTPIWVAGKPSFLPEEFFWLIGVTHRGFPEEGPVRNTFGSNISFRVDVLEKLGGFDANLGRKGDKHVQGEETELAARLRKDLGGTLYYTPDATVGHKVFEYRTRIPWLVKRAFWQGYSKRMLEQLVPESGDVESAFLRQLIAESIPDRTNALIRSSTSANGKQLVMLVVLTASVGFGYLFGILQLYKLYLRNYFG